jgi:NADH:ubiquinone oxidoreductase subunit 5 (subunit L)/multisubunit Na+/H+ antiporter MnhA subunit
MNLENLLLPLLAAVLLPPALLGSTLLLGIRWKGRLEPLIAAVHSLILLGATILVAVCWSALPSGGYERVLPPMVELHGYHWLPILLVDGIGLTYAALVALIFPIVVRFSIPSFFREPGASRYWFLVTLLGASLWLLCFAGNIDTLFVAWEMIGVSSVMLIAFFRTHVRAGQNSLRALVYYRIGDFGILLAAVLIHHGFPDQRFSKFATDVHAHDATWVALAILLGSLAKSAQLPLSPWLHRAMEGPASSSAIFYGALSVHLGPFLLLRTRELWLPLEGVRAIMLVIGLATAAWATAVGRTRPDAKTSLAYSTMAQIGIMYAELALGLEAIVLVHMFAHAGLRAWQFLRSSSLIQDFQDNPVFAGSLKLQRASFYERILPLSLQKKLYLAAVRQFWIDSVQWHFVARPFLGLFRAIATLEDRALGRRSERIDTRAAVRRRSR